MKSRITLFTCVAVLAGLPLRGAEKDATSWEKLKSLVGDWSATHDGQRTTVSYRLVSNGTALMETMEAPDATEMVTVYHPDGTGLLMTHYCGIGNQPRMRSQGLREGKIDFAYVDAANVASPAQLRMTRLVMSFPDKDHLVHEWTSRVSGQQHVGLFEFARKK